MAASIEVFIWQKEESFQKMYIINKSREEAFSNPCSAWAGGTNENPQKRSFTKKLT